MQLAQILVTTAPVKLEGSGDLTMQPLMHIRDLPVCRGAVLIKKVTFLAEP